MKKLIFTFCFLLSLGAIRAEAFKINENRASFGAGLGWNSGVGNFSTNLPSPNALVERSVIPLNFGMISIGAQFGFHHGFQNVNLPGGRQRESGTAVYFLPRMSLYFHEAFYNSDDYDFPRNLDLYTGIGIGFNHLAHKPLSIHRNYPDGDTGFNFGMSFFIGARYYFKPHVAAFAELGYGLSLLNVGLTIRY